MTEIYINGRFLTQPMTGVERYAYNMCKAMAAQHVSFTIICPHAPIQDCYDISQLRIIYYGRGNSHFWEQCVLPFFLIGKKNYIVLSFTGLGSILVRNKIMTIHDLSFLENPRWFSRPYYWWYKVMTPLAVRTSKHIITVSEFSKREILRFYPFLKEQDITVVYNATDETLFRPLQLSTLNSQLSTQKERFALAVSSLDPRKNFARLIEAFQDIPDCKLYIVGARHRVFGESQENQGDNIRYLGRVSDEELVRLYNQAVCFIFPSLYEGFGLPPIEAMSCGCPVLVSDIPVLHEVCGDAATYFDPYNPYAIRKAIQQFLTTHGDRSHESSEQPTGPVLMSRRKNLKFLLSIIPDLYQEHGIQLVVVGGKGWKNSDIRTIVEAPSFPKDSVIFCGFISNEELASLYCCADSFISAALMEGFGMPQLEALKCGCPIITAHNTAMIEVAQGKDGAITVEGYDPQQWQKTVLQVIKERPKVKQEQLADYDWNLIIRHLQDYYMPMISNQQ